MCVESNQELRWSQCDPRNSRPSLDQSNAKLKTIGTWSFAFSRAASDFLVFTLDSHWLLIL